MITAIMVLAMLDLDHPRYVFRTEVNGRFHCYNMPSPEGSKAMFCDVKSPATGKEYVVVIVVPGGISIQKQ